VPKCKFLLSLISPTDDYLPVSSDGTLYIHPWDFSPEMVPAVHRWIHSLVKPLAQLESVYEAEAFLTDYPGKLFDPKACQHAVDEFVPEYADMAEKRVKVVFNVDSDEHVQ